MKYWLYKNFPTIVKRVLFQYEQNESVFDVESISEMPGLVHKVFSVLVTTPVLDCTGRSDDLLSFDLTPQVTGCHACLYFDVLCKEETDCCLISYSSCSQRLWLNGEFFSILGAMVNSIYTLKLKKGRNTPANIPEIARCLARLRRVPAEEIAMATTENAKRLFGM